MCRSTVSRFLRLRREGRSEYIRSSIGGQESAGPLRVLASPSSAYSIHDAFDTGFPSFLSAYLDPNLCASISSRPPYTSPNPYLAR